MDEARKVVRRILIMIVAYSCYALAIVLLGGRPAAGAATDRAPAARASSALAPSDGAYLAGRQVWLEHKCQVCHSIYGLGGHAGPDLTNAFPRLPEIYVRNVVANGYHGMPAFEVTERELQGLIDYLSFIGETGVYPPSSIHDPVFGSAP